MIISDDKNFYFKEDDSVDVKRYLSLFISNWYWFAIALFMTISIAYIINRYSEKIFTVTSTLLIKDDQIGGGLSGAETFMPGGDYFKYKQNLKNEIGILKSYTLNKRVIDSLPDFHILYVELGRRNIVEKRLYNDCPFIVVPEKDNLQPNNQVFIEILPQDSLIITLDGDKKYSNKFAFSQPFQEQGFNFKIEKRNSGQYNFDKSLSNRYYFRFLSVQNLANQYKSKVIISPIEEEASLVTLALTGPVAEQETDYLNKLMGLYIVQGLEFKNQTADSTISFVNKQLKLILDSLSKAEIKLENFRRENKLMDLSKEAGIVQDMISKYENEKTGIQLQKIYYNYLKEYLARKNETGDIVSPSIMGVTDPEIIRLVQDLAQAQKQRNLIAMNLNVETKPLTLMDDGIMRIKNALNENVEGGIKSLNSALNDVDNRISLIENEMGKLPIMETKLINIQRKFDINNSVYTYLLEKRAEAGIAKASNVSDNRIIDKAHVFNSVMIKPKSRQNYMMAFLIGLLIPIISIFLLDYFNNTIIDKKDVEKGTNAPIIGYISHNDYRTEIPVFQNPGSSLSESFRSIRTNLKYFITDIQNPVIAISSTISTEGKTFISINLATILALLGKKVLLVGIDLRKPRIHRILGIAMDKGMSTFLSGNNEFNEIFQKTEIENLFYAPAGPVPPNPAELIETPRMKDFIEHARKEFDYVIIDTPPIAIVTDALLLAPYVDLYLLVVRQRYTSKNTLGLIQELYNSGKMKKLGVVINDISLTGYYGYGLRYGYSLGYSYIYGYNYYGRYGYSRYGKQYNSDSYYTDGNKEE